MAILPSSVLSKDLTKSSFNPITPEIWAHRTVPMDDDDGLIHLRPVMALSQSLVNTFKSVNPIFQYKAKYTPPKRILTNPSIPRHNEGNDNENYDLIMHVGDVLGSGAAGDQSAYCWKRNSRYTLIDMLGQGTFGQVVKCRDENTGKLVAVKVLKNKPAYFKQGLLEIGILTVMNTNADPTGERRTLRFLDHFLYRNHLCLVNELLSVNLYEVIKQNMFHGVSANLIRVFTRQILDALIAMDEAAVIHCDLKPENILMQKLQGMDVTLIDFGSACFEKSTMYSYIQSRHYRSPEVLLGLRYTCAIDMWSLGCIAAELFLGIPVFPGANEYNQMFKIREMLGNPPSEMIRLGNRSSKFFVSIPGTDQYRFKSIDEYERDTGNHIGADKRYFSYKTLTELAMQAPMKTGYDVSNTNPACQEKEIRRSFLHFLLGCLQLDPTKRWTPNQARAHPFINEQVLPDNWSPPPPLRPIEPLMPPESRSSSSRTTLEVNGAYHKFCNGIKHFQILDVANNVILANLREPLMPSFQDKPAPPPPMTRGNRARSLSDARLSAAAAAAASVTGGSTVQTTPSQIPMSPQSPQTAKTQPASGDLPRISIQGPQQTTSQPQQTQHMHTTSGGHSRKMSAGNAASSANTPSSSALSARMARRNSAGKPPRRSRKFTSSVMDQAAHNTLDPDYGAGTGMTDSPPPSHGLEVPGSGARPRDMAASWGTSALPPPPSVPEQTTTMNTQYLSTQSQPQAVPNGRKTPPIVVGTSVSQNSAAIYAQKYRALPHQQKSQQGLPPLPQLSFGPHSPDAMDS